MQVRYVTSPGSSVSASLLCCENSLKKRFATSPWVDRSESWLCRYLLRATSDVKSCFQHTRIFPLISFSRIRGSGIDAGNQQIFQTWNLMCSVYNVHELNMQLGYQVLTVIWVVYKASTRSIYNKRWNHQGCKCEGVTYTMLYATNFSKLNKNRAHKELYICTTGQSVCEMKDSWENKTL